MTRDAADRPRRGAPAWFWPLRAGQPWYGAATWLVLILAAAAVLTLVPGAGFVLLLVLVVVAAVVAVRGGPSRRRSRAAVEDQRVQRDAIDFGRWDPQTGEHVLPPDWTGGARREDTDSYRAALARYRAGLRSHLRYDEHAVDPLIQRIQDLVDRKKAEEDRP